MSDRDSTAPVLRTERLELRPFAAADADALHAVFVDPEVRRYLLDDSVVERDWVKSEIASSNERFERGGLGLWSIRPVGRERIVGFVGFREFFRPPVLQLIYGLVPEAWGEGLAAEASAEAIRYAFEETGQAAVEAATDLPNSASRRVMERLGMSFLEQSSVKGRPHVFYRLRREAWKGGDE